MFRTPLSNTPTFKLILGISLCTVGGAMLYAYFKIRDDDEEINDQQEQQANGKQLQRRNVKPKEVTIKLVIDNDNIPILAGRGGVNISCIEEKTNTKIKFSDKDSSQKNCEITGLPDNVKEARALLLKQIERSPIVKEVINVPPSVCGKIMGMGMQEICRQSLAKVSVDSGGGGDLNSPERRTITITGNQQQVNIARKLIEEKIQEDEDLRRAVDEVEQTREPRRSPTNSVASSMYSSQTSLSSHQAPRDKLLSANVSNKAMEVYVSAVASPSKFWVQIVGPQSKKLDDLVKEMTDYYTQTENRKLHEIREPYLGQIVAAIFRYDGKWYRAEIVGILPNQLNPNEVVLDLYFVDYGDSEYVAPNEVFELRTDFLTLRFQAVECFMANIKSTLVNTPDTWPQPSVQKFEDMTEVAAWKKLIARVVTYKERTKAIDGAAQYAAARDGTPIPGIELYDPIEGVEVNLGHIMISHGFALPMESNSSPSYQQRSNQGTPIQSPTLTPPTTPLPPSTTHTQTNNNNHTTTTTSAAVEDAHFAEQLQHLAKTNNNSNKYLSSNATLGSSTSAATTASLLNNELHNGNHLATTNGNAGATSSQRSTNLNGSLLA